MTSWLQSLNNNPLAWLLEDAAPAVRHCALRQLLGRPIDDPEVIAARSTAMATAPIAPILAAQDPEGFWVKPGPGYAPKYRGTVWQVIFLDQLGADGLDPRVRTACAYVLSHTQSSSGGFAASGTVAAAPPPPSSAIHCLHGNVLRALLGFGWGDDERVQRAVSWQAAAITGDDPGTYYQSGTNGPGFACAHNAGLPCAWGAVKGLSALARVPPARRTVQVERAVQQGVGFLLSVDPASAEYPAGYGNTKPSSSWFKLGFPCGYVADVLQVLEVLCELGYAKDQRLQRAVDWLLGKQDRHGRWMNEHAYSGRTWGDFDRQGQPSKWVTLRACRVVAAARD
jgi:hypothetical protein